MSRHKNYCLTIFNFDELKELEGEDIKYSAYGDEKCPTTGKEHKQAFVCFKNARYFNAVKKMFPTAHIEPMRGKLEDNEKYCSKEGSYHEFGEKPMKQSEKGEKGKEFWIEQLTLAKQNPDLCDEKLQLTHRKNLEYIYMSARKKRKFNTLDTLDNWWYVGEAGSGKSKKAREENPDAYIKQCNKWWNDYDDQDVVIIEDIDTEHHWMAYFINQWADRYSFPAETKGGQLTVRPKKIIVTSRYTPDQIFKDASTVASINRRFNFLHFKSPTG